MEGIVVFFQKPDAEALREVCAVMGSDAYSLWIDDAEGQFPPSGCGMAGGDLRDNQARERAKRAGQVCEKLLALGDNLEGDGHEGLARSWRRALAEVGFRGDG